MHFSEILIDNRISCNFADIEGAENVIFCRPIEESLDNVATIVTNDNEFIHNYITESNGDKFLVTRIKLSDGEIFDNVKFRLVVCEDANLPYSTIDTHAFDVPSDFDEHTSLSLRSILEEKIENVEDVIEEQKKQPYIDFSYGSFEPIIAEQAKKLQAQYEILDEAEIKSLKEQKVIKEQAEAQKTIENYKAELLTNSTNAIIKHVDDTLSSIVNERKEIQEAVERTKKYTDTSVSKGIQDAKDYARRILELGGGGGSNAVQYAKGGTMNGTLNVTGQYLSGGVDLASIFNSGGTGDPAVNSLVHSNSANWNNTYTVVNANSSNWNTAYTTVNANSASWGTGGQAQTLSFDPNTAKLSISLGNTVSLSSLSATGVAVNLGQIPVLSSNWNTAYTLATGLTSLSSNWQSVYTTVCSYSAGWGTGSNVNLGQIPTLSSNWNSSYTTLTANSANWNTAYTLATGLTSLSSNWQSVYTTVCSYSAGWGSTNLGQIPVLSSNWNTAYTLATGLTSLSSNWQSTYTTVCSYSAGWGSTNLGQIPTLSSNWNSSYTTLTANSSNWNTAYTLATGLTSLSSNWQNTYTTLCATSANWNTAYTLATGLTSLSSNWQSTYTSLCSNSANWNTAYTLATGLTSLSSNWQSVYTTVCSYSAGWGTGSNVNLGQIPVLSSNWNTAYTLATGLTSLSSNWQSTYTIVSANSASWGTGGVAQNLTFNPANANLSITNGNTVNLSTLSGNNPAVNSAVINNSGNWNSSYTTLTANSAFWQNVYTTVCSYSAGWGTGSNVNLGQIPVLSANWNNSYTTLTANSASWNTAYTLATGLSSISSSWVTYSNLNTGSFVKYTDINSVSSNWNTAYTLATGLTSLSSNWQNSYTAVATNSATWAVEGLMPVSITTNSTVGGLTQGTVFTANTPLSTILQRMIVAAISATYTYPTLSASTSAFAFEVGSSISPIISSVWTQNDAGSATSYTILSSYTYSTGYSPITSFTSFTTTYNISSLSSVTLSPFYLLSTIYIETSATYAQGPQKQDNYGNNSGTPIPAYFIVSSAFGLSAYRKGFYSADTYSWSLSDSNAVRSLTGSVFAPNGFTVNVPAGTTRLVFAYPSNYALTITNPSFVNISPANGYNASNTLFTTSGVQVYGANNFALTGYRVFTYVGSPATGNYAITVSQPTSSVSYTSPSINNTITTTTPLCGEIGALSAINFTSSYVNADAGAITAYAVLTSWDNTTYTQITAVNTTQTSFTVTTPSVPLSSNGVNPNNTFYIQTSATFTTGPVKYNSYNDLNATGQIQAGSTTKTTSVAVSAFRRMYYTFDTSTSTPVDSNSVRALTGVINNPQAGNTYTFTQAQIPAGLKRMVFAYPAYAGPITYAQDTTDNFSYLSNLTLTTVSVSGANGQYPINYNVYTYIAGGTFGNFNFTLTI